MEYFIVERGEMWDSLLEILERKRCRKAVTIQFMYGQHIVCCLVLLQIQLPQIVCKEGKAKMFADQTSPCPPTRITGTEKILVIDGHTAAFTGSPTWRIIALSAGRLRFGLEGIPASW